MKFVSVFIITTILTVTDSLKCYGGIASSEVRGIDCNDGSCASAKRAIDSYKILTW